MVASAVSGPVCGPVTPHTLTTCVHPGTAKTCSRRRQSAPNVRTVGHARCCWTSHCAFRVKGRLFRLSLQRTKARRWIRQHELSEALPATHLRASTAIAHHRKSSPSEGAPPKLQWRIRLRPVHKNVRIDSQRHAPQRHAGVLLCHDAQLFIGATNMSRHAFHMRSHAEISRHVCTRISKALWRMAKLTIPM